MVSKRKRRKKEKEMHARANGGYRVPDSYAPSSPEYVQAFKEAVQARQEYVRRIQELRRSSAASPVRRDDSRRSSKVKAIRESSHD